MSEPITVEVAIEGREVWVDCSLGSDFITAQEAYELHQALCAVLPELVQPFTTQRITLRLPAEPTVEDCGNPAPQQPKP
jgi:hypothetical protein